MRRDQRGTTTLWVLGLSMCVLFLGGLSLDLWRVVTVRRSLVAMADAGATAGADGIDPNALRRDEVVLDPMLARAEAQDALRAQSGWAAVDAADVAVGPDEVTVTLRAHVSFTLLGIFVHGDPVTVRVAASAQPRVDP